MRALFWHPEEGCLRSGWRVIAFVLFVGAIANPLVLLLDATKDPWLEASFKNVCIAVGFVAALALSVRFVERRSLSDFGFSLDTDWRRELVLGIAIRAVLFGLVFLLLYATDSLALTGLLRGDVTWATFSAAVAGQLVRYAGGSVFEELFTRSYLLRTIAEQARQWGMPSRDALVVSVALTSTTFGALHLANPGAGALAAIKLSLLGVLFAIPMIRTGRLGMSIGLHFSWNVVQSTVLGFPNGGQPSRAALFVVSDSGARIWGGGACGPEGGLAVLAIVSAALPVAAKRLRLTAAAPEIALSLTEPRRPSATRPFDSRRF